MFALVIAKEYVHDREIAGLSAARSSAARRSAANR
jgi:hypothetical protein